MGEPVDVTGVPQEAQRDASGASCAPQVVQFAIGCERYA